MANGDIIKVGSLFVNNSNVPFPQVPTEGNLFSYSNGNIEIRQGSEISWVEVTYNYKRLYICDRNILANVSWDILNSQNLIEGKEVILGDNKYLLRVLKSGTSARTSNHFDGALPLTNEWDNLIGNESNLLNNIDFNCSSVYSVGSKAGSFRGSIEAKTYVENTSAYKGEDIGYRPVLEFIERIIQPLPSNSTLKEISDFYDLVLEKKEIEKNNLKNALIEKSVEVSESDSMSSLIDKAEIVQQICHGKTFTLHSLVTDVKYQVSSSDTVVDVFSFVCGFSGNFRVAGRVYVPSGGTRDFTVNIIDITGKLKFEKIYQFPYVSSIGYVHDIEFDVDYHVNQSDTIIVKFRPDVTDGRPTLYSGFKVCCDFVNGGN